MPAIRKPMQMLAVASFAVLALAWVLSGRGPGVQAAQKEKPDLTKATFWGVDTCFSCHSGNPENFREKPQMVLLTESDTWQLKDRHSLAYVALEGKRGQDIGKLLNIEVTKSPMCLSCHATTFLAHRGGDKFSVREGVSCDGCHGPAEHWINLHSLKRKVWRDMTPEQKEELGMRNLRDPVKRAEMCASCHVGNAAEGKVVTHAMYAAGHPPLPSFEVAAFSKNMPPHWTDMRDVAFFKKAPAKIKDAYHFDTADFEHTKLVMAGGAANLRTYTRLLAERAGIDLKGAEWKAPSTWPPPWILPQIQDKPEQRWPEYAIGEKFADLKLPKSLDARWPEIVMAQADCYACHHELKSDSWRQKRKYHGKLGRPQLPEWTSSLVRLGVPGGAEADDCAGKANAMHALFTEGPFGPTREDGKVAVAKVGEAAVGVGNCTAGLSRPETVDRAKALGYLKNLTSVLATANYYPDYDTARVIAWAFSSIWNDGWNKDHPNRDKVKAILDALNNDLNLTLDSEARKKFVQARWDAMAKTLTTGGKTKKVEDVTQILQDDKGLRNELYQSSEGELSAALDDLGRYDPVLFRKRLAALSQALSGK